MSPSDTPPARAHSDLRLLGPALLAWASAAGALGLSTAGHLAVAAASALTLAALGGGMSRGAGARSATASAVVGVVALTLALVVLVQLSAAAHCSLRARGGILDWARERAAVTAVVTVTGDPIEVVSKRDEPRVLLEGTARVLDARGRRHEMSAPLLMLSAICAAGSFGTTEI